MRYQLLTGLCLLELSALAVLWRSVTVAPLVAFERDLDRPIREHRRNSACDRLRQSAV